MPYLCGQGWHWGSTLTKWSFFQQLLFIKLNAWEKRFILSSITKTSHPIVYHQNHGHMPRSISFSLMCFNCNPIVVECKDFDMDLFNPYQLKICLSDRTIHVFEICSKKSSDPYVPPFLFSTAEGQKHYSNRSAYHCSWHIFQLDSNQPRH